MAGTATKKPPEKYRFRVRTAAGEEVISPVIELGDRNAGLANAHWGDGEKSDLKTKHNEDMQMQVDAPGHEGRRVRFLVERLDAGKWVSHDRATGVVKGGVASATIQAVHPAAESKTGSLAPMPMRFKVEFV
jgi:hypothetical protein